MGIPWKNVSFPCHVPYMHVCWCIHMHVINQRVDMHTNRERSRFLDVTVERVELRTLTETLDCMVMHGPMLSESNLAPPSLATSTICAKLLRSVT